MKWYVLEKNTNFNLPEWARTFGLDEAGVVYIPAAVTQMSEGEVCKQLDRDANSDIPIAQYNDHLYVPSTKSIRKSLTCVRCLKGRLRR